MTTEGEPPLGSYTSLIGKGDFKKEKFDVVDTLKNSRILCHRVFGNVFGYPKNLLDFKRPIIRCGPLSVF